MIRRHEKVQRKVWSTNFCFCFRVSFLSKMGFAWFSFKAYPLPPLSLDSQFVFVDFSQCLNFPSIPSCKKNAGVPTSRSNTGTGVPCMSNLFCWGVSAPPYPFPLHPKQKKPGDHPPLNIPMGWMINSRVFDLLDVRIAKGNPVRLSPGGVRRVPFGALYTASLTVGGGRDFEGKK